MNIPLDEVIYFDCITSHPTTGAATDADSTPTFEIFEEATDTDIGVGGNLTKRASKTGNYRGSFTLSAANGFEVGKWYNVTVSATVNSIAGKATVKNFRVVAAEAIAGKPKVDVDALLGTAWLTPGTAGTPDVNVKLISDDATAANNLELAYDGTGYIDFDNTNGPKTLYVTTGGNDSNAGTKASPKLTIAGAISAASPGDTIKVGAGTFAEGNTTVTVNVPYLTIEGVGNSTHIQPNFASHTTQVFTVTVQHVTIRKMKISTVDGGVPIGAISFTNEANWFTGEGLTLAGTFDGLNLTGSEFCLIKDCDITGTYDGANVQYARNLTCINTRFTTDGSYTDTVHNRAIVAGGVVNAKFIDCRFRASRAAAAATNISAVEMKTDTGDTESSYASFTDCIFEAFADHASNTGLVQGLGSEPTDTTEWKALVTGGRFETINDGSGDTYDIDASGNANSIVETIGASYDATKTAGVVRSNLSPTVPRRTLDVTATGAGGVDWGNVEAPTTTLDLSGTTIKTATDIATAVDALPTNAELATALAAADDAVLSALVIIASAIADVPTVAEFEARSLPSADYFVVGDYTVIPTADDPTLAAIAALTIPTTAQIVTAFRAATVSNSPTAGTFDEAMTAAWAQGFGRWVINSGANTLTLYGTNGSTIVQVFDVAPDTTAPTSRTPQ